jgi:Uma2 family endonuclease
VTTLSPLTVTTTLTDLPRGYELIAGQLVEKPGAGALAAWVAAEVYRALDEYCERTRFGLTFVGSAGFRCFEHAPDTIRKPDVTVMRCDPAAYVLPAGWVTEVPALVVEVVSPFETPSSLAEKVADFRTARTPLIWVINPQRRQATIHRIDGTAAVVTEPADLSGENVLPGLVVPLAAVLPAVRAAAP